MTTQIETASDVQIQFHEDLETGLGFASDHMRVHAKQPDCASSSAPSMSLRKYREKRNFSSSPEPPGNALSSGSSIFVVQKHLASHLHYDFRIEVDGVLKSWAVPKGPSLDPKVKRLAIEVEDHPIEYADFEGIIAEGNYGAGKVIVWDNGQWHPLIPFQQAYTDGNIKFVLTGTKLRGKWALIRTKQPTASVQKQWLLIKERDEFATDESTLMITNSSPKSVLTGRDIHELKSAAVITHSQSQHRAIRTSHLHEDVDLEIIPGIKQASIPNKFAFQLATATASVPIGDEWLHEIKIDGYRLMAVKSSGRVKLLTRNQHDWTSRFEAIAEAVKSIPVKELIIDGEVAAIRPDGVSDFAALQASLKGSAGLPLVYMAFDLLYCDTYDLRGCRLLDRKLALRWLLGMSSSNRLQFLDHVQGGGPAFFDQCRGIGLEGIVSKRVTSTYRGGRSDLWLKRKAILADDFIVIGYLLSDARKGEIKSLLLAAYKGNKLKYCGKVGSGLGEVNTRK